MAKHRNSSAAQQNRDPGILYGRYDKNTVCGQLIENLKRKCGYGLNKQILNLIFLSEVVERFDWDGVNPEVLDRTFDQSRRLFAGKLKLAEVQLNNLSAGKTLERQEENLPLTIDNKEKLFHLGELDRSSIKLPTLSSVRKS